MRVDGMICDRNSELCGEVALKSSRSGNTRIVTESDTRRS